MKEITMEAFTREDALLYFAIGTVLFLFTISYILISKEKLGNGAFFYSISVFFWATAAQEYFGIQDWYGWDMPFLALLLFLALTLVLWKIQDIARARKKRRTS